MLEIPELVPPAKTKRHLPIGVGVPVLFKRAVLHRGEEVLQPIVVPGIEFVPEDNRMGPSERLVANVMKGAEKGGRGLELREVEFENGWLPARICRAISLIPNDFPAPGGPNAAIERGCCLGCFSRS